MDLDGIDRDKALVLGHRRKEKGNSVTGAENPLKDGVLSWQILGGLRATFPPPTLVFL